MSRVALWRDVDAIPESRLKASRYLLIALIAVTSALPLLFVQPDDAPLHVNVIKYLAKTGAFLGTMFMVWQFLLGFRGAASSLLPDLSWVADLHKKLGQFGVPIVFLHPIFIGIYYLQVKDRNIYALDLSDPFSWWVLAGMVALAVVIFVIVTSLVRAQMGFYRWLYTHLASYLVPPLMIAHAFNLGPTIQGTWLRWYWWGVTALVVALYVYRLAHKFGVSGAWYRVAEVDEVADRTTEILMEPEGTRRITPASGQFIYLKGGPLENAHPYTVSAFDEESGRIGVTVSAIGSQSDALQKTEVGERMFLDGPFGVFTRPAMATDLKTVLIAGGVGITAFRRLWRRLEEEATRETHLFYGNERYSDIAYRDELDALSHVHVVHVLNDEEDFDGEQGFVTVDVLERNLPSELSEYQFLLCGPAEMVEKLEDELREAGIPDSQIREELFAN